jgi:hypothetical protein
VSMMFASMRAIGDQVTTPRARGGGMVAPALCAEMSRQLGNADRGSAAREIESGEKGQPKDEPKR